jgi:hypothetical protein
MVLSELCVLAHPLIRKHRNIIHLEGFCWEEVAEENEYLPVLIFQEINLWRPGGLSRRSVRRDHAGGEVEDLRGDWNCTP